MTTSNETSESFPAENAGGSKPAVILSTTGDHWLELTATISRDRSAQFGHWMDSELSALEDQLVLFASPRSRSQR